MQVLVVSQVFTTVREAHLLLCKKVNTHCFTYSAGYSKSRGFPILPHYLPYVFKIKEPESSLSVVIHLQEMCTSTLNLPMFVI